MGVERRGRERGLERRVGGGATGSGGDGACVDCELKKLQAQALKG